MLGYRVALGFLDDYCCMGGNIVDNSMNRFCIFVRKCFECEHSRQPTRLDILHQMNINKGRGWPTMFASLDYMDWRWENSRSSMGRNTWEQVDNKSIVLEVIQ